MVRALFGRLRASAKSLPFVPSAYSWVNSSFQKLRPRDREDVFSGIFEGNTWSDAESRSGAGSNLRQTAAVRRELPLLLQELSASSLLDAPCGDFRWLSEVDLGRIEYVGIDIVPALIAQNEALYDRPDRTFRVGDVVSSSLPAADVILCRDCLVHLSFAEVHAAVENFVASGSKYLLATTFTGHRRNYDKPTGSWRPLNLCNPPFRFPSPMLLINEECPEQDGSFSDKCLGLWELEALGSLRR